MLLLIDMDGVVADFDRHLLDVYGKTMEEMTDMEKRRFWDSECVADRFFANSPPIREGIKLVRSLVEAGLCIAFLTSTGGKLQHVDIAKQKLDFLQRHSLGHLPVVFATGTESKAAFANPNSTLVDDREKVVSAFRARSGSAHLFTRDNWKSIFDTLVSQEILS